MIRGGFVIFGLGMVCNGFYKTMIKVNQRNILISEEVVNEEKYTYPSITFCVKVIENYKRLIITIDIESGWLLFISTIHFFRITLFIK